MNKNGKTINRAAYKQISCVGTIINVLTRLYELIDTYNVGSHG